MCNQLIESNPPRCPRNAVSNNGINGEGNNIPHHSLLLSTMSSSFLPLSVNHVNLFLTHPRTMMSLIPICALSYSSHEKSGTLPTLQSPSDTRKSPPGPGYHYINHH